MSRDGVHILLVDDDPAKLLSYEVVLRPLGVNLFKAATVQETFAQLLANDIGVILMDVSMPELDGFQLAGMIREHPRYQQTAIIFVSAIHLEQADFLRGYEMGAVDYVPVPVIPEVLRAKVRVFADLHRKTRELEQLNRSLEDRVAERTAELEASSMRLRQSESRRNEALAAGQMGSWDWDLVTGSLHWDAGQFRIAGHEPGGLDLTLANLRALVVESDLPKLEALFLGLTPENPTCQTEFRIRRRDGEIRCLLGSAAASLDSGGRVVRISGVTADITERKKTEERQALLAREVDHRAKNALAVVQSIVRLSRGDEIGAFREAIEGRISALARTHTLLAASRWDGADLKRLVDEELAPYRGDDHSVSISGPAVLLEPSPAQAIAVTLHELITNAAKYGALASSSASLHLHWKLSAGRLAIVWEESGLSGVTTPEATGFGLRVIKASVTGQLSGSLNFAWLPTGLRCEIDLPMERANDALPFGSSVSSRPPTGGRLRVLVAEDETLVAMMMVEHLESLGLEVEGPFRTVGEAAEAARHARVGAALLDVSLAAERIYPVADILAARGVPFAFVTGYGAETIDRRYAHRHLLQKPVAIEDLNRFLSEGVPSRARRAN